MVASLHDMPATMSADPLRADNRPTRLAAPGVRTRVRVTLAESPELYLREEMG